MPPSHLLGLMVFVIAAALATALPTWFLRHASPLHRTKAFMLQCIILFGLPWFFPNAPIAFKIFVTLLCCAALPPKLAETYVHPTYWAEKPIAEWLKYLAVMFILTPRLHTRAPRGVNAGLTPLVRGAVQVSLGFSLLLLAFRISWPESPGGFLLEHTVKIVAAYLAVFDGMFVLLTGILRMLGLRVLELSNEPALAVSPADFWRRYNCEAGRILRENVFAPLGGKRSPRQAALATFLINGILHEYLACVLIGRFTGFQLAFFGLHGLATAATLFWRPTGWMRPMGWLGTLLFLWLTSILFFMTIDQFLPIYQSR